MTLPDERYRAIQYTERFLKDLCDRSKTPRVPKAIRQRASSLLKHYPSTFNLDQLAERSPDVIMARIEPLTRLFMEYEQEKKDA